MSEAPSEPVKYETRLDPVSGQWAIYDVQEERWLGRFGRGRDAREDAERHVVRMNQAVREGPS